MRTKSDLFSGVRRLKEGSESENGRKSTRDDDVEPIVERQPPDVNRERDVNILLGTTLVLHHVPHRFHFYTTIMLRTRI